MEENNLIIKNEEIEVGEKSGILVIDFSKDTTDLISSFKIEQKEVTKRKNETKSKYLLKLASLNESHKEHLDSLQKKKDEVEQNYKEELASIEALKSSEKADLDKSIEDLEKDYLGKTEMLLKDYESSIAKSNEEIEKINSLYEAEKVVLEAEFNKIRVEHDEKMAVLNSDINAKIEKMKEESNKNIDESKAALVLAEEKYTKELEDSEFEYDYSVDTMDRNNAIEQEEFDTVTADIKSTLEAKVARHEKFMNKSMEINDTRAVKQHKKEILMLQKNAEKRLKDLTLEHENNIKEYEIKKKQSLKEHIEETANLNLKITQFRDAEEFKIKNFEAKIENDLECIEFRIKSKIQEEIHNFNEAEKDHAIKVAECISKHEIDLEKELENQSKLKIAYDKEAATLKVKQDEALATIQKDFIISEETLNSRLKSIDFQKSIDLSNIDYEMELAKKALELDLSVILEIENIELHDLDAIVQGEVHDKNVSLKNDIHTLVETKEDFILAFEEEVFNKSSLSVKFLEKQKANILADKQALIAKITEAFEPKDIPKEEPVEKTKETSSDEAKVEAEVIVEKFDLEALKERKELSLKEIEKFFAFELSRIDTIIALLNEGELDESVDTKERKLRMFESSSLLLLNAQLRNSKLSEDSNVFEGEETKTENATIKEYRNAFEKEKMILKASYDKVILEFDKNLKSEELLKQKQISKEELELSQKVADFNKQIKEIENTEIKSLKAQDSVHKANYSKAEQIEKAEVKKVTSEFAQKESIYKSISSKIEKQAGYITKKLDVKSKLIKKEYDQSSSKNLKEINTKLQMDLKALQTK